MRTSNGLALVLLVSAAPACSSLSDGDWTNGERGRTRWQTTDGLCPGLFGGCSLDVPIAVGASVRLRVDGIDGYGVLGDYSGSVARGGMVEVSSDGEGDTHVPILVQAAGPGRVGLSDLEELIDAATVTGRVATALECGRWPTGRDLEWRMDGLEMSQAVTLTVGSGDDFDLVCRAMSSEGPMLSANAITWTIVSGSESLDLLSTGGGTGSELTGARVAYRGLGAGTAVVRARLGEVSTDLTITIE